METQISSSAPSPGNEGQLFLRLSLSSILNHNQWSALLNRMSVLTSSEYFGYIYLFLLIFTCSDHFIVTKLMCYDEESISLTFLFEAASYRILVPRREVRGIAHAWFWGHNIAYASRTGRGSWSLGVTSTLYPVLVPSHLWVSCYYRPCIWGCWYLDMACLL